MPKKLAIPVQLIEQRIYFVRDHRVMLSPDLADLYQVNTRALVQAVKRNRDRFPRDFMFQLNKREVERLSRSQSVILKRGQNIKYAPYAFTEQRVAMLSAVLRSNRAVQVSIAIVRVLIRLREILANHTELADKIKSLEGKYEQHDEELKAVFDAIRGLLDAPEGPKRRIGFISGPTTTPPPDDTGSAA